MNLILFPTPRG